jgi:hypothetical protein
MVDLINKIIDKRLILINKVGKVISVDKANASCDIEPLNGDADKFDVRLTAQLGNANGFVVYPKVGSFVIFTSVDNNPNLSFVSLFSEIDEIIINNGINKGMVKAPELVSRLNAIEKAFNKLLNAYNLHTHNVTTSGSATAQTGYTTSITPDGGSDIKETDLIDIENLKIQH